MLQNMQKLNYAGNTNVEIFNLLVLYYHFGLMILYQIEQRSDLIPKFLLLYCQVLQMLKAE